MKKQLKWTLLTALALIIAGCAKPYSGDNTAAADQDPYAAQDPYANNGYTGGDAYGNGNSVYGTDGYTIPGRSNEYGNQANNAQAGVGDYYQSPEYGVNVVGGPAATAKDRIIYFSFDSASLDSRSEAVVREHARYLREHPQTRVVLEGHTDERGSREYNIGLGERRAYSVHNLFQQEGVNSAQMRVLSYGEERPAAACQSETCYAKNRRVVIIY